LSRRLLPQEEQPHRRAAGMLGWLGLQARG